jgi:hypothetical protein
MYGIGNSRTHLDDVAEQAKRKATRAALLAECCEAAGDLRGAENWRRRQGTHEAIRRATQDNDDGSNPH